MRDARLHGGGGQPLEAGDGVELARSSDAPAPADSLGRQLLALGTSAEALDRYRASRGLRPMARLEVPKQELVCAWLLRGGVERVEEEWLERDLVEDV